MKMLEMQMEQLVGCPMSNEGRLPGWLQGPKTAMAIQTHSGETEDQIKEKVTTITEKVTTEQLKFEMCWVF
jgi:hypothetical protein